MYTQAAADVTRMIAGVGILGFSVISTEYDYLFKAKINSSTSIQQGSNNINDPMDSQYGGMWCEGIRSQWKTVVTLNKL